MPNVKGMSCSTSKLSAPLAKTILALGCAVALSDMFDAFVVALATVELSKSMVTVLDVVEAGSAMVLVGGSEIEVVVSVADVGSAAGSCIAEVGSVAGSCAADVGSPGGSCAVEV
jgi:hypothetical protein